MGHVECRSVKDKSVIEYIDSIRYKDDVEDYFFKKYPEINNLSTNAKAFVAIDDNINTMLLANLRQSNNQDFLHLRFIGDNPIMIDELINSAFMAYKDNKILGVVVGPTYSKNDSAIASAITDKYSIHSRWYASTSNSLSARLISRGSSFEVVKLTRRNAYKYTSDFIKFLTQHDNLINESRNRALGNKFYDTRLQMSVKHQIKLKYFVESMLKSQAWTALMIHINDELVGFIKSKVTIGGIHFPDLYLPDKYRNKYSDQAYKAIIKACGDRKPKYIGTRVYDDDKKSEGMAKHLFIKPIAIEYVSIL